MSSSERTRSTAAELGAPFLPGVSESYGEQHNVMIEVLHYCQNGEVYASELGEGVLYAIVVRHPTRPSVLFRVLKYFPQFLAEQNVRDSAFPATMKAFCEAFRVKVQINDSEDTDEVEMFKVGTVVFFVSDKDDGVKEFLKVFDDFNEWRAQLADPENSITPLDVVPDVEVHFLARIAAVNLVSIRDEPELLGEVDVGDATPPLRLCRPGRLPRGWWTAVPRRVPRRGDDALPLVGFGSCDPSEHDRFWA